MEVTDLNDSTVESMSGASPLDKVVEIMSDRLNAFGVAETLVRKCAIEIQIPDRTTKQDRVWWKIYRNRQSWNFEL